MTIAQLVDYINRQNNDPDSLFLGVFLTNDTHIGNVKLQPINRDNGSCVFGILIGDVSVWGQGYGTAVTQRIVEYAFHELGLEKIELRVMKNNRAAMHMYRKLGFSIESDDSARQHSEISHEHFWMELHRQVA